MEGINNTNFLCIPDGVISAILSLTSPPDVCRSATVASVFKLASETDNVWEKFLPPDYQEILARSDCSIEFSSKKELYFRLCDPILIDGGTKVKFNSTPFLDFLAIELNSHDPFVNSFWLDRCSGKKCYMETARHLRIIWGEESVYWTWKSMPQSRFSEVANLRLVWWLDISGTINARILSKKTTYVAYLVVGFKENSYGLDSTPTEVTVEIGDQVSRSIVCLCPDSTKIVSPRWGAVDGEERVPHHRADGWMEIELGDFYNDEGDDEVKISLKNVDCGYSKRGLIIEGVEARPRE